MWIYEKKLEYPVKIKKPDPRMAKVIITQYGGPDGELAASIRYLSQRFSMVTPQAKATLNDIGTEVSKLSHDREKNFPRLLYEGWHWVGAWRFCFSGNLYKRKCVFSKDNVMTSEEESVKRSVRILG